MIAVFISRYSQGTAENQYQTQHEKGLELLACGLKKLYGLESLPMISCGAYGKPYFKYRKDIHFNISHCDGIAVCAIAGASVGIDVERIAPVTDNLAGRVLTAEELGQLSREPKDSPEYLEIFYRFWTLKESAVKQSGQGLARDLRELPFHLDASGTVCCSDRQLHFYQKKIGGEYILSLCSEQSVSADDISWNGLE